MYLEYFGLNDHPFRITPDTKYLFMTPRYEAAVQSLHYGITQHMGFFVLTGEVGSGKTTLVRHVLSQLDDSIETALLVNSMLSVPELLRAITSDFGLGVNDASPQQHIDALNSYLIDLQRSGRSALLVIDESQNLSDEALEMVRMLTNLETEHHKLIQILLVGQPELRNRLQQHHMRQLRQRITVHQHLEALSKTEIVRYVMHRLRLAGAHGAVHFEPTAYRLIWRYTKGLPRMVNLLCDRSLTAAYSADTPYVTRELIRRAYGDLKMGEIAPPAWQFWRRIGFGK